MSVCHTNLSHVWKYVDQLLQSGDAHVDRLPHPLGGQLREGRADGLVEAAEAQAGGEVGVDGVIGAEEVQLWKDEFRLISCQKSVVPPTNYKVTESCVQSVLSTVF